MKCISCGNLVPDSSAVCPYCNANLQPVNPSTPIQNVPPQGTEINSVAFGNTPVQQAAPVVPQTPVQPVLPQDQQMVVTPVEPAVPVGQELPQNNVVTPVTPVTPVMPEVSTAVETPIMPEKPVVEQAVVPNPVVQPVMESAPVQQQVSTQNAVMPEQPVMASSVNSTPVASEPPSFENMNANPNVAQTILTPDASLGVGEKVASEAPTKEKKSKGKMIGIIIAVVLVIALIAFGVYAYMFEFKSGDKRIDAVVNNLLSFTNGIKNESVELASGNYNIDANIRASENEIAFKANGKYAYDLAKKMADYTINVESLNVGEELLDNPLNVELYYADAKAYVLLQNFYDKYIYADASEYDALLNGVQENNINYQLVFNGFKGALKSALKSAGYKQEIKDVTVNGKTKKGNVVTIKFDKQSKKRVAETFVRTISNNTALLDELAKMAGKTADELKKAMEDSIKDTEYDDVESTLEIITEVTNTNLIALRLSGTDEDKKPLEAVITPIINGYDFSFKMDGKDSLKFSYTNTKKRTSTAIEKMFNLTLTMYTNGEAVTVTLALGNNEDVNPKVDSVNVKNSVDIQYLTENDYAQILNNVFNFGKLGQVIQAAVGSLMPTTPDVPQVPNTPVLP